MTTLDPAPRGHFDLVVFDWDGTLYDSTAIIVRSIQAAVRDVGGTVPSDEQAAYVIGLGLTQALAHAAPDVGPDQHAQLGERYRHHYMRQANDLMLFAGVLELLGELRRRGKLLAVATGKSRRGLNDALAQAQLRGVFDSSRTADETAGKPDPLMLHELMDELQVSPGRTLMIGDTTHDLQMAHHAGVASVGVSYGAHDPAAFAAWQPRYVASTVALLHDWLVQHG